MTDVFDTPSQSSSPGEKATPADAFDVPETVERDRWGRPMIVPPDGGKPVGYSRCTRFVGVLDDTYNLQKWSQRMVAIGLSQRTDLLLSVAAHSGPEDKKTLDKICDQAKEAATASAAATTGTALHRLTEMVDSDQPLPAIPPDAQRDIDAYRRTTQDVYTVRAVERFTVYDDYRVGGTPDRVVEIGGEYFIADVKTGSIDWGAMKIAMQLAMYSRSTPYSFRDAARTPWPWQINQDQGLIIHLPAGTGKCELHWIDIQAGWAAVQTAAEVRGWRNKRDWLTPYTPKPVPVADRVRAARTLAELTDMWHAAQVAGEDMTQLKPIFAARKAELS